FNWIAVLRPFGGTAVTLPGSSGTRLEVENFDEGRAGHFDTDATNQGGQYRSEEVDIETTSDSGGGYDVGWAFAGEWLQYSVDVSSAGTYDIGVRVASEGTGGTFHIEVDGIDKTGPMAVPNTGDWQTWTTITKPNVPLSAGNQVWRVVMDSNGPTTAVANFNWISLASGTGGPSELVVYTWNIQGDTNLTRTEGQMHWISTLQPLPQVVVLQEADASTALSFFVDKLNYYTGSAQWAGVRFADSAHPGLQGTIILTSLPVLSSDWRPVGGCDNWAPSRYAIRAALNLNGSTIQIFNTHLQARSFESGPNSPNCPDNPDGERHPERQAAINDIRTWIDTEFSGAPVLVGGDFNASPSFTEIADSTVGMTSAFNDAWVLSGNQLAGETHTVIGYCNLDPNNHYRIDYWFSDKQTNWSALESSLPTGGEACYLGYPSDHFGLLVRYLLQ
ncbi:MAG TPA: carbohydrate-binding protein, partial [Nitrospiraceae bacterium]|nr:carbohydrate-binding protein [Nitrospiraceae bacterium]